MDRCLSKSASDRFADGGALLRALNGAAGHGRGAAPGRRLGVAVSILLAAVVTLSGVVWQRTSGSRSARTAALMPALRQLTFDGQSMLPVYSPDGTQIIFDSVTYIPVSSQLAIADIDDANMAQNVEVIVTEGVPTEPQWSPDGKSLVYSAAPPKGSYHPDYEMDSDLYIIAADGTGAPRNLTPGGRTGLSAAEAGRAGTPVPADHFSEFNPRFSPDGTRVVFTSDRSGHAQIYEVELTEQAA